VPIGPNDVMQIVTFQWKAGGWLALACAAIGGVLQWLRVDLYECPLGYSTDFTGRQVCSTGEILDLGALGTIFGAIIVGGCVGVGIALILLALGVRHDTLGIDPDA
jgi:xanthine/uracil permease